MAEPMSEEQREPISPDRLAHIRKECGPRSVYLSGAAGDGLVVMANELLDEIDRLTEVLEASRVVRNAAESSSRVYKAVVDRLKADRTRLRGELDRCAGLNRDLVKESVDATTRAETAERELAELRERIADQLRRRAHDAALADVDGYNCDAAVTWMAAATGVEEDFRG